MVYITYIQVIFMVNVGKYTIHGCYGKGWENSAPGVWVLVPKKLARKMRKKQTGHIFLAGQKERNEGMNPHHKHV